MAVTTGCSCSVYGVCSTVEKYIAGYKPEHIYLGLQVVVAFIASMLPITIPKLYDSFSHESAVWVVVTVSVVMEPDMGGSLRKGLLRVLGALLGGGLAFAITGIATGIGPNSDMEGSETVGPTVATLVVIGLAICGFILTVHKQRYPKIEHFFFVAIYTMPVTLSSALIEDENGVSYDEMLRRVANVVAGVLIATATSVLVFPIRARWVLERDMASMLIRLGDLTVWILSQVCAQPNPDFSFPGTSYCDKSLTYGDDGVEAKLAPVMDASRRLGAQLANLSVLLTAADKEWYFFKKPRVFPTAKYRLLLQSCQNILAVEMALLYWLQSTVTNLALVHASAGDVRELGVRVSSVCTALSHLVHPPKGAKAKGTGKGGSKKGGGSGGGKGTPGKQAGAWRVMLRLPSPWHGRVEVDQVLHAAAAEAAAETEGYCGAVSIRELDGEGPGSTQQQGLQQQRQQAQQRGQQGQQQQGADLEAPAVGAEDNPFAELVEAQLASESQSQQGKTGEAAAPGMAAAGKGPVTPPATPPPAAAAGAAAAECGRLDSSDAESVSGSEQQQEELELGAVALARLCAMADATKRLMQTLTTARASRMGTAVVTTHLHQEWTAGGLQHAAAFDTLAMVVGSGTGIARQLAAMFTALDPGRAPLLHDYILRAVAELGEEQQHMAGRHCETMTQQQQQPAKLHESDSPK